MKVVFGSQLTLKSITETRYRQRLRRRTRLCFQSKFNPRISSFNTSSLRCRSHDLFVSERLCQVVCSGFNRCKVNRCVCVFLKLFKCAFSPMKRFVGSSAKGIVGGRVFGESLPASRRTCLDGACLHSPPDGNAPLFVSSGFSSFYIPINDLLSNRHAASDSRWTRRLR